MTLTAEHIKELKSQLSEQIQNLPAEQKEAAQKQIDSLSPQALATTVRGDPQAKRRVAGV